ncbi:uncharacterized protein G2W53_028552 [Senna tora]|uniref:Uncharacterized protein n=1 Tax=Senna tora TaxID=362788 RepID=A0A834T159_9FABA|nr:uncharacterized protein G2W53_028552 [Senna tora]
MHQTFFLYYAALKLRPKATRRGHTECKRDMQSVHQGSFGVGRSRERRGHTVIQQQQAEEMVRK